jgi:hypothetical protein
MTRRTRKHQTRSSSEKELLMRLLIMLGASIALLVGIFFLSVPVLSRLVTFWDIISPPKEAQQSSEDTISPQAPFISNFPSAVNEKFIDLQGYAESGSTVELYLNDDLAEKTITDSNGDFEFKDIALYEGTNTFYAKAIDQAGNESPESEAFAVILDKEPPELVVNQPKDGFSTNDERMEISGTTEPNASVFVNQHQAVVQSDGSFSLSILLSEGENELVIEAVDRAGNKSTQELVGNYRRE